MEIRYCLARHWDLKFERRTLSFEIWFFWNVLVLFTHPNWHKDTHTSHIVRTSLIPHFIASIYFDDDCVCGSVLLIFRTSQTIDCNWSRIRPLVEKFTTLWNSSIELLPWCSMRLLGDDTGRQFRYLTVVQKRKTHIWSEMPPTKSFTIDDSLLHSISHGCETGKFLSISARATQSTHSPSSSLLCDTVDCPSPLSDDMDCINDYGLFWDSTFDDDESSGTTDSCKSQSAQSSSSMHSKRRTETDNQSPKFEASSSRASSTSKFHETETCRTIFVFENNQAPVSCRSFEPTPNSRINRITQVCVSIAGFRIVQDLKGERAEYKVVVTVDGITSVGWKEFSDFKELADACIVFSTTEVSTWSLNFWISSNDTKNVPPDPIDLRGSMLAWEKILESKIWVWFRKQLSVQKLMEDAIAFEAFLRNILYEIPCPAILVEFVL